MIDLTLALVDEARTYLRTRVLRTPLEESRRLSAIAGVPVHLKREVEQVTGSFKARGALFFVSRLSREALVRGVACCSAGNHGLGTAFAAREAGAAATVFLTSGADDSKRRKIETLGARTVRSAFPGYDDTESWAREEAERLGLAWVPAFDDPVVMAGNGGTLASEILEELPDARTFLFPVGGGGLAAGAAYVVSERRPAAAFVAAQLAGSPALAMSLARGAAVTRLPAFETLAAGLEGGIGARTFAVLRDRVARVALVEEDEILEAVRLLHAAHGWVVEPTGAVAVAALLSGKAGNLEGPVVVPLTGRNVSESTTASILGAAARMT